MVLRLRIALLLVTLGSIGFVILGVQTGFLLVQTRTQPILTTVTLGGVTSITGYITNPTTLAPASMVTISGTFEATVASPICGANTPPCLLPAIELSYLVTTSGDMYRLLFATTPDVVSGLHITVTGTLLIPSSWDSDAWLPTYRFVGDITDATVGS